MPSPKNPGWHLQTGLLLLSIEQTALNPHAFKGLTTNFPTASQLYKFWQSKLVSFCPTFIIKSISLNHFKLSRSRCIYSHSDRIIWQLAATFALLDALVVHIKQITFLTVAAFNRFDQTTIIIAFWMQTCFRTFSSQSKLLICSAC